MRAGMRAQRCGAPVSGGGRAAVGRHPTGWAGRHRARSSHQRFLLAAGRGSAGRSRRRTPFPRARAAAVPAAGGSLAAARSCAASRGAPHPGPAAPGALYAGPCGAVPAALCCPGCATCALWLGDFSCAGRTARKPPVSSSPPLLGCLCSVEGVRRRAGDLQKVSLHRCRGIQWLGWLSPILSGSPLLAFFRGVLYCFSFTEKKAGSVKEMTLFPAMPL